MKPVVQIIGQINSKALISSGSPMRRRDFLRLAGTLAPAALYRFPITLEAKSKPRRRVRPSDPGWPSATEWEKLNQAVGGNLIKRQALFAPCASEPWGAACTDVMKNMRNPFYISDQTAGNEVSGWLGAWTPAASAYAVAARNAADVVAGVNFAREHNLRLVVRGTGHSYLGTSNAADSLLVWTHHINKVTLHDSFVPQGCEEKVAPQQRIQRGLLMAGVIRCRVPCHPPTVRGIFLPSDRRTLRFL